MPFNASAIRTRYDAELLKTVQLHTSPQTIFTAIGVNPSTPPVITSPFTTAPTPSGVPVNQVARLQFEETGQIADRFIHRPDQMANVAALMIVTVNL